MLKKLFKPKNILIAILLMTAALRLYNINYPDKYVFDEVYHAFTAKEFKNGHLFAWEWWHTPPQGVAYEWTHPPLAKNIMAFSMFLLNTESPWAYRLPGVIFGIASVYLIYLLGKQLFRRELPSLISAFVFSLDGLNFVQSRTGMNDIYFVTFMIASLLFYLRKKYLISAICLGLTLSSKWTGLYAFGLIFILIGLEHYKDRLIRLNLALVLTLGLILASIIKLPSILKALNLLTQANEASLYLTNVITPILKSPYTHFGLLALVLIYVIVFPRLRIIGYYLLIPPAIYIASYIPMFLLGAPYSTFTGVQQQMWWYHTGLKATHDYTSPWWSWPINAKPVWYFVDYFQNGLMANIFASGNPLVFWLGFGAILVSIWDAIKHKSKTMMIIVLGYLMFWLPWALSPRIMFLYHYSPSVPFLALALGAQLGLLEKDKYGNQTLLIVLGLILISFLLFYPILIGLPLPKDLMMIFFKTNQTKNPFI